MIKLTVLLVVGQSLTGPASPVDFRLLGPATPAESPIEQPLPSPPEPASTWTAPARSVGRSPKGKPSPEIARGFGAEIPLGFAARQIIPSRLRVTYGAGVSPEDPVSWTGGNPWNRVLQDAIRPLGLRMTVTGTVVSITR